MINFTEFEEKQLIDLYKTNSINQLCKHYSVSADVIRRILNKHKIRIKSYTEVRSLVKGNPFEDLSNPEVQYWLGWLATDGNIHKYSIKLDSKDKDIIENFAKFCGLTHINTYQPKKSTESRMYRVQFSNKNIAEYLINLGITRNKSSNLELKIPMTWNLLLGIIEGDGWTYKYKNGKRRTIGICSISEKFIKQIEQFFINEQIKGLVTSRIQGTTSLHIITINGNADIDKMRENLYNVSFPILERKKINLY